MKLEEAFDIVFPDEDYEMLVTVGALCEYIEKRSFISDPDMVWTTVQRIISDEFCIPLDEIKPTSRWVEDLKIG